MAEHTLNDQDKDPLELTVSRAGAYHLINWFFGLMGPKTWMAGVGVICILIKASVVIWIPKVFSLIIDNELINPHNWSPERRLLSLRNHLFLLAGVILMNIVFNTLQIYLYPKAKWFALRRLRNQLMRQFHRIQLVFHDKQSAGRIRNKIINDVSRLQQIVSIVAEPFFVHIVLSILAISLIIQTSPMILLALVPIVPALLIIRLSLAPILKQRFRELREGLENINVGVSEQMDGIRLIRAHGMENHVQGQLAHKLKEYSWVGQRADFMGGVFGELLWGTMMISRGLVYLVGGYLVIKDQLRLGELVFMAALFQYAAGSINMIIGQIPVFLSGLEALRSVHGLLKYPPKEENEGKPAFPRVKGKITLDHVNLQYPGSEQHALKDIDVTIESGETIALVGSSGSGKSTLASVIMGFYEPQAGSIRIDDFDIFSHDRRTFRQQIGVVTQDIVLFNTTVRDNISFAKPEADKEEILDAAKRAHADEFIQNLDDGYDTMVGDKGVTLSGGQKQRLAIARALLRDPRILILDEATSALDAESEQLVQEALDELMKNRTTILIAHRLSTVRNADRILVMEDGRIVEEGSHDQLLEDNNSRYSELVAMQLT